MKLEHMTFAVSKRLEHEMFHKREQELIAALADKDAKTVIAYELAEAAIETIMDVYQGKELFSVH